MGTASDAGNVSDNPSNIIGHGSKDLSFDELVLDDEMLLLIQQSIDDGTLTDQAGNPIVAGGGGGQATIQFKDEGTNLGTSGTATIIDFVGAGVTATRVSNTVTVTIPSSSYTTEEAQDAVGAMVDATLVYTDATPLLSRAALTGAITASAGSNATLLGSFTKAQLDTAVSDGNVVYVGDTIPATSVSYAGSTNIVATNVETALDELDTDKQADITFQEEGVTVGTAGGFTTLNFIGSGVTVADAGSGVLSITVSASSTANTTSTVNGARFTYQILSGTPVLTFGKTNPLTPTLTVAGGTIKLIEVRDTIVTASSVNPVYTFNATWANAIDVDPSFVTKKQVSSGQVDIDNTPQIILGSTGTTQSVVTINAVASDTKFTFIWNNI